MNKRLGDQWGRVYISPYRKPLPNQIACPELTDASEEIDHCHKVTNRPDARIKPETARDNWRVLCLFLTPAALFISALSEANHAALIM